MKPSRFQRSNPRTAFRQIANESGETVADCPSFEGGPALEEAMANAEVIVTRAYHAAATPGPWYPSEGVGGGWHVRGGPDRGFVAMIRRRDDEAEIAAEIAAACPAERSESDH